jgi:hypothetical protein
LTVVEGWFGIAATTATGRRIVQSFDLSLHLQDLLTILRHAKEIVIVHAVGERERESRGEGERGTEVKSEAYLSESVG